MLRLAVTRIRYDIIPQGDGWSIAMGGAVGPPYSTMAEAIAHTEFVARALIESGDEIEIIVWRGGKPTQLEVLKKPPEN
jgi:hypothetical protein